MVQRIHLSALGLAAAFVVVLAACGTDKPSGATTTQSGTYPNDCRPQTCSTLAKNCGIVSDGCGGNLRCGSCAGTNNDCRNNVCERDCSSNDECPSGAVCISGSCSDKCHDSSDCPSGQTCNSGSCIPNAPATCNYDSQCRADERCVSGKCVGSQSSYGGSCRTDSQCRGGEACRNGTCTNLGSRTCRYSSDCGSNQSCVNGYCSRDDDGYNDSDRCDSDYDCPGSEKCRWGYCRDGYEGRDAKANCITNSVALDTPFGSFSFYEENWLYSWDHPNGQRVDSCTCPNNSGMRVDYGNDVSTISCNRCVKNGNERTCYE